MFCELTVEVGRVIVLSLEVILLSVLSMFVSIFCFLLFLVFGDWVSLFNLGFLEIAL